MPLADFEIVMNGLSVGQNSPYCGRIVSGMGLGPTRARIYQNPGADGVKFGREFRDGKTLVLEGSIHEEDCAGEVTPMGLALALEAAWNWQGRKTPQATVNLSLKWPGVAEYSLAGRPDLFDYDVVRLGQEIILWSATFNAATP